MKFPSVILASASPRRAALLQQIGVAFTVHVHAVDETHNVPAEPVAHVSELSRRKAQSVAVDYPEQIVVGADTIVVCDDRILGKPDSDDAARATLRQLSGRAHRVFTSITVVKGEHAQTGVEQTTVFFRELSDDMINWYLTTGEPFDKAGSYGIQGYGALLVDHIEGCYFNVVGFPLVRFEGLLRAGGFLTG